MKRNNQYKWRFVALALAIAMCATLLAACATKPNGGPPTEEEIAEFRRTHPVVEEGRGFVIKSDDPIKEPWGNARNVILSIEIVGEREDDVYISNSVKDKYPEDDWAKHGHPVTYYLTKITEIIALDPGKEAHSIYYPYSVGDSVYVEVQGVNLFVGEKYIVLGRNAGEIIDGTRVKAMRNDIPYITVSSASFFYLTDNSYVISMSIEEDSSKYTGKSAESIRETVELAAEARCWIVPNITKDEEIAVVPENEGDKSNDEPSFKDSEVISETDSTKGGLAE